MAEYYEDHIADLEYSIRELESIVGPMAARLKQAEENSRAAMKLLLELQGQFDALLDNCSEQQSRLNRFSYDMNDVIADIGTLFEAIEGRTGTQPPALPAHHGRQNRNDYDEMYDDYGNDDDYEGYEDYEEYDDEDDDYNDERDEENAPSSQSAESDSPSTLGQLRRRFTRFFP